VGGGERDAVERAIAQLDVAVARPRGRRGRRDPAGADERGDRDHDQRDRDGDDDEPAQRPSTRAWLGLLLGRLVDHPQDRGQPGVDEVHAGRRDDELDDRVAGHDHHDPDGDEEHAAQHAPARPLRLRRHPGGRPGQRLADVDRPDQRRRRRGHDGAAPGEDPPRRAQVAEVRVPDAGHGVLLVGAVDVPDRRRAREVEEHDQQHPGDRGADPQLDDGAPSVGRERQRAGDERDRQQRQHDGQDPQRPHEPAHRAVELPEVAPQEHDAIGLLDLLRQPGPQLLERGRDHGPDVRHRERDRVLVVGEDRGVDVADGGAEQAAERAAPDHLRRRRLDQRARSLEVGLPREHQLVRDLLGDQRPDAVVAQRGGRAVGELVGVDDRAPRVARQ
jgi:hypothetical protein